MKFLQYLKDYIEEKIEQDSEFSAVKFIVNFAFDYNTDLKFPQVNLAYIADYTNDAHETFNEETVDFKGLQITFFAKSTKIGNKNYNAYFSALKICDKLKEILSELKYSRNNKYILSMTKIGSDFVAPYDNTNNLYWGALRYNINIDTNYFKN